MRRSETMIPTYLPSVSMHWRWVILLTISYLTNWLERQAGTAVSDGPAKYVIVGHEITTSYHNGTERKELQCIGRSVGSWLTHLTCLPSLTHQSSGLFFRIDKIKWRRMKRGQRSTKKNGTTEKQRAIHTSKHLCPIPRYEARFGDFIVGHISHTYVVHRTYVSDNVRNFCPVQILVPDPPCTAHVNLPLSSKFMAGN